QSGQTAGRSPRSVWFAAGAGKRSGRVFRRRAPCSPWTDADNSGGQWIAAVRSYMLPRNMEPDVRSPHSARRIPRSVGEGFKELDERIDYFIKFAPRQNFG